MATRGKTVRVTGVLGKDGRIRLNADVPLRPGPVEVTLRPAGTTRPKRKRGPSILDMAGVGAELWRDLDVEKWLDDLRSEWDREPP